MGEAPVRRLAPEERKAMLIGAAEETFALRGYTQSGLAEVADLAGVSKTLLYHYFPDGRPELYREVMDRMVGQVLDAVRGATRAVTAPPERMSALVASLVTWFEANPDSYRLLVLEPWGSGDPSVVGQAMAVRARIAGEIGTLLAPAGQPLAVTQAGGSASLGALLQICELVIAGQVTADEAIEAGRRFLGAGLAALDLL